MHRLTIRRHSLVLIILALLFALGAIAAYFADGVDRSESVNIAPVMSAGIGQLTTEPLARQTFVCDRAGLASIDVMYSNYNRKVQAGTLTLTLLDSAGATVAEHTWEDLGALKNYTYITLSFPAIAGSAGQSYTLAASADCTDQRGVTLRMGELETPLEGFALTQADGTPAEGQALTMRLNCVSRSGGTLAAATMAMIALCLFACVPLPGRKEARRA